MKKGILTLLIALVGSLAMAQNNTPVVSSVKIYDHEDGTGSIEARVAGIGAYGIITGTATISGDKIEGGSTTVNYSGNKYIVTNPSGTQQTTIVVFPITLKNGGDDEVDVTIDLSGAAIIIKSKSRLGKRPKKHY